NLLTHTPTKSPPIPYTTLFRSGVATADDHDVLALRGDRGLVVVALLRPVGRGQVLHRLVDALEVASGDGQVAPDGGAAGEDDGVVAGAQVVGGDVDADVHRGLELGALRAHLGEAAVEVPLLHLELGDAVAEQAADAVGALVHGDVVARAGELLRGGEAGGPGPDDRDGLAGLDGGRLRAHPALRERPVDDLDLDPLDGDRVLVDAEDAGALARGGAQPPGELREVVGGVEAFDGLPPVAPVDQVVPFRDEVAEGAALVAERDAAVHAAARLAFEAVAAEVLVDLGPALDADGDGAALRELPPDGQEALRVGHVEVSPSQLCAAAMTASSTSRPSA